MYFYMVAIFTDPIKMSVAIFEQDRTGGEGHSMAALLDLDYQKNSGFHKKVSKTLKPQTQYFKLFQRNS